MKTLSSHTLFWLSVIILLFSGCKDDEDVITPADRLAGTWNLQSTDIEFTINEQDYITFIEQIPGLSDEEKALAIAYIQLLLQQELDEISQGTTFEFKADNSYQVKVPGETPETGKWALNEDGTKLTIDEGTQDEIVFEVESLTDTSLILSFETVEEDDIDQDGETDTLAGKVTLNLSR